MTLESRIREAKRKAVGGKGGAKDRCRKGKSCSATCIFRLKECLVEMPEAISSSVKKFNKEVNTRIAQFKGLVDKAGEKVSEIGPLKKIKESRILRTEKIKRLHRNLVSQASSAAMSGSRDKYNRAERNIIRLERKFGKNPRIRKEAMGGTSPTEKGQIWERNKRARQRLRQEKWKKNYNRIKNRLISRATRLAREGERAPYDNVAGKLEKITTRVGAKFGDTAIQRNKIWKMYEDSPYARVRKALTRFDFDPMGKISFSTHTDNILLTSMVRGHKLELDITPSSFSFRVNDSYHLDPLMPLRDRIGIVKEVRRQFPEVVKHLDEGSIIRVKASTGDGREEARRDAYQDFGFSTPDRSKAMFGRVENGKIVPATESEYNDYNYSPNNTFERYL